MDQVVTYVARIRKVGNDRYRLVVLKRDGDDESVLFPLTKANAEWESTRKRVLGFAVTIKKEDIAATVYEVEEINL